MQFLALSNRNQKTLLTTKTWNGKTCLSRWMTHFSSCNQERAEIGTKALLPIIFWSWLSPMVRWYLFSDGWCRPMAFIRWDQSSLSLLSRVGLWITSSYWGSFLCDFNWKGTVIHCCFKFWETLCWFQHLKKETGHTLLEEVPQCRDRAVWPLLPSPWHFTESINFTFS